MVKKIYSIEDAVKIRDNYIIKQQKGLEVVHKEDFDTLYEKYINNCIYIKKLSYNTLLRKKKTYNKYLKGKINQKLSKTDKNYWTKFIDDLDCSLKQKNELIKQLNAFFNWCIAEEFLISNPLANTDI